VSVNPDVIEKTREIVFDSEKKVLINSQKYSTIEEKRKELAAKLNINQPKKDIKKVVIKKKKKNA
jgi:hypothetical protein